MGFFYIFGMDEPEEGNEIPGFQFQGGVDRIFILRINETGLVYAKYKNPVDAALKLKAGYLVPLFRFVHTKDVEKAHNNHLKVIVWTINTKKEAREYIAKGVDGIASDKPDIFSGIS